MDLVFFYPPVLVSSWFSFIEPFSTVPIISLHSYPSSLQAERFLVELRYVIAVLWMYFSTFRQTPTTILSQLFGCLQDKINVTTPIPLSGTSILFIDHFCSAISSSLLSCAAYRKWTAKPELVSRRDRSRTIVGVVSPASRHQNV